MTSELFVCGRVCLLGEHSDWSGAFRRFNRDIVKGYTIVVGTNQGLYARIRKHPSSLVLCSTDNDGNKTRTTLSMDAATLLKVAQEGGFWSYCAGVAYRIVTDYHVEGLEIDNYKSTLPLKKGLSSSAAICVLTARAFNRMYDLNLTTRGEMEYAYSGEIMTPSQCGRLDQACAFGSVPVLMTYDGEYTSVEKIQVKMKLYYVVVDLCAKKDTVEILKSLQSAFPYAQNENHENVHKMLGEYNEKIIKEAIEILTQSSGSEADYVRFGELMNLAQANFDKYGGKVCASQLKAPVLHKVLEYEKLQPYMYGGKCVGAGGDGTAQLLCKGKEAQEIVQRIVETDLNMFGIPLTIEPLSRVTSAVIPAAGFGQNLFPATKGYKQELFPIIDPSGNCKPMILNIVEELVENGIERIVIIVQPEDLAQFERLFKQPVSAQNVKLLSSSNKSLDKRVSDLGKRIKFVLQEKQLGFGHAVLCAKEELGIGAENDLPFVLALGHHVYRSNDPKRSCVEQLLQAYRTVGINTIGLKVSPAEDVSKFGTVAGTSYSSVNEDLASDNETIRQLVNVTKIVEKPTPRYAESNLRVSGRGLRGDEYLTVFGLYILDHKLFKYLEDDLKSSPGRIGLTQSLDKLRQEQGLVGCVINGERLHMNNAESYLNTLNRFSKTN